MTINGIEIILDGALPTDELVGYVVRAKDKSGERVIEMLEKEGKEK